MCAIRARWDVLAITLLPPEPAPFYAEDFRAMKRSQLQYRFHLPPIPMPGQRESDEIYQRAEDALRPQGMKIPRKTREYLDFLALRAAVVTWLNELQGLHKVALPDDNPSGTDALAWMRWVTFLSACILYDPPKEALLQFARHHDYDARPDDFTFWHDPEEIQKTRAWSAELETIIQRQLPRPRRNPSALEAALRRQLEFKLRLSVYQATREEAARQETQQWKHSTRVPDAPQRRGRPERHPLEAVQCDVWARDCGWSDKEIAASLGLPLTENVYHRPSRSYPVEELRKKGRIIRARHAEKILE